MGASIVAGFVHERSTTGRYYFLLYPIQVIVNGKPHTRPSLVHRLENHPNTGSMDDNMVHVLGVRICIFYAWDWADPSDR